MITMGMGYLAAEHAKFRTLERYESIVPRLTAARLGRAELLRLHQTGRRTRNYSDQ